jgi:hypothetical protein
VALESAVGVPEMTPVVVLKLRPVALKPALIEYEVTGPPLLDGVLLVIACPLV